MVLTTARDCKVLALFSCFSDENFRSIGQAVAEKIEFLFQKRPENQNFFLIFYVLKPDVRACSQDIAPMAKIDPYIGV